MSTEDNKEEAAEDKSSETPLFRQEALQHKKGNYFGKTLIVTPVSFSIWTFGIFIIAVVIGLYIYFGEYSRRQTVDGILVPDKGLITVFAKSQGTIVNRFVQQGETVQKGQLLYLISTEQESLSEQSFSAQQVALLEKQVELQKSKIAMFEKNAAGYEDLLKHHYISETDYQKRQDEYLTAQLALHNFEKDLTQAKVGINYAVRAPEEGTISVLISMVGDHVTPDTHLCSIVPKGSVLEGQLFVPASKAGFVKTGQKVLLKYRAYPYQRFGLYEATVGRIDKSINNPQDYKNNPLPIKIDEVYYRVTAVLQKQTVDVYGNPYPLTPGMTFEGVILGEKRKIWQWILDPIYSLKGSI